MDKETRLMLIEKYLNGRCTIAEEQRLMEWYDAQEDMHAFTSTLDKQTKVALEDEMFRHINQQLLQPTTSRLSASTLKKLMRIGVAAAMVIGFFTISLYKQLGDKSVSLETGYGEVKSIILPDNSEILLNGNSSITYEKGKDREIWLDGEAFFSITRKADNSRFLVHLADTLTIEVVGTEFNVHNRSSGIQIALKSGKIILVKGDERIEMCPNEVIQIGKYTTTGFERSADDNISNLLAWQDHRIILDNTSLSELLGQLTETHGIQTRVHKDNLLERKASGSIPIGKDHEVLLNHIATLYGLVVAETNDERQYVLTAPK